MTTRSLKEYLADRPKVESAGKLGREHNIQTTQVTRILREHGYSLNSQGSWDYSVVRDTRPVDPYNLHLVGISPTTLDYLRSRFKELESGDPILEYLTECDSNQVLKTLGYCLMCLDNLGQLPIRGQLTAKGWKGLEE